jgi:hypothetical protein
MQQSDGVREGLLRFYDRFSSGDPAGFADVIAEAAGVSVIGTGPGEGHDNRDDWISTYAEMMRGEMAGTRLEGHDPRAYEEGAVGWASTSRGSSFPTATAYRPGSPPSCATSKATGRFCTCISRLAFRTSKRWSSPQRRFEAAA